MKLQNLSIIFLVIIIPLILILAYYLNLQQETLELQAEYDTKLAEATKEGIKAFEINTVDWTDWVSYKTTTTQRKEVKAAISAFVNSLANNLNVSGTAKEYMANYIPAVAATMYDGYYVYAPNYVPITIEDSNGVQLYYDKTTFHLTTDSNGGKNLPAYKPKTGVTATNSTYTYTNEEGNVITETISIVTDIENAEMEYKHILSNHLAYVEKFSKPNMDVVVNYTLDNRIYINGTKGSENIEKDGYLVYFEYSDTILPRITINTSTPNDERKESDIIVKDSVSYAIYSKKVTDTITNKTHVESETLTEQIVYKDEISSNDRLGTFKYIYDIKHEKLYYDETKGNFFTLEKDKTRNFLLNTVDVKVGDSRCRYKSVSLLLGTGETAEYKKIYQVLNGRDKGKWYIDLKEDAEEKEEVDTEITGINLVLLGLDDIGGFAAIYKDFSAINYYVEAYAFTNWVKQNLGGEITTQELKYDSVNNKYQTTTVTLNGLFDISIDNDPENEYSFIAQHKREVMKNHIMTNLNLAISNYSMGTYEFRVPFLTDSDWDQVFSNISLISFFQGVPIGLKYYNNYAIATSTTNREYVDPGELYFSGADTNYHRVYCEKCQNIIYTGYRSVEYVLKEFSTATGYRYYYQHDDVTVTDKNSETACYYCVVNKANYKPITDGMADSAERTYKQSKSYNEALARERYYQQEDIIGKVGAILTYHYNVDGWDDIIHKEGLPDEQEVEIGAITKISLNRPTIVSNNQFVKYVFMHWVDENGIEFRPGDDTILYEDKDLYAVWRISLSQLRWNRDYVFINENDAFKNGVFNNTSYGNVTDGSISYIYIDEMPGGSGSRVQMVGNENKKGKGATWAYFDAEFLDIAEFSFKYYLNSGHSFNAGGFLFNVTDTNPEEEHIGTLEGYMLSINFNHEMLSAAENNTGAIFKFRYEKGNNSSHFEYLDCIQSFDLGEVNTSTNSEANGTITIKVEENGYLITGTELSQDIFVPVNNVGNDAVNRFGFFSDHFGSEHGHTCSNIGYFKLEDVVVTVVRNK